MNRDLEPRNTRKIQSVQPAADYARWATVLNRTPAMTSGTYLITLLPIKYVLLRRLAVPAAWMPNLQGSKGER
jgi:hypothetical protein